MGEVAEDEDEDEAVHLVSRREWIFGRCTKTSDDKSVVQRDV